MSVNSDAVFLTYRAPPESPPGAEKLTRSNPVATAPCSIWCPHLLPYPCLRCAHAGDTIHNDSPAPCLICRGRTGLQIERDARVGSQPLQSLSTACMEAVGGMLGDGLGDLSFD